MSVNIRGMDKILSEIESRLGKDKVNELSDKALKAGADVFVKELESQFELFKDEGFSIEEIDLTDPYLLDGVRTITVRWRGPKNRYRIIHLNEFGTVKHPNPRGKGAIARALLNANKAYKKALRDSLRSGF